MKHLLEFTIHPEKILSGIRVLDFSRLLPGPLGTQILSQMGAEVTKIESPKAGDWLKGFNTGQSPAPVLYYLLNNRKTIRTLDFESENEKVYELIQNSDILIEQFRPGVMNKMGFSYPVAHTINPRLIYISLTGYTRDSELCDHAGHDINYLALGGLLALNTDENGKPVIPRFQLADVAGGSYSLVMACLGALYHRSITGKGQYIHISITKGLCPFLALPAAFLKDDSETSDLLSGGLVNYNVYQCSDGRWMALGALEIKFWDIFCEVVQQPSWKRDQLEELRIERFPIDEVIAFFRSKSFSEWMVIARHKNCCLSPVLKINEQDWYKKTADLFA